MTGFKSKRNMALDEEGMYLVHHTKRKDDDDDDTQVYKRPWVSLTEQEAFDCFSPNPVTHSKNIQAKLKEKNT